MLKKLVVETGQAATVRSNAARRLSRKLLVCQQSCCRQSDPWRWWRFTHAHTTSISVYYSLLGAEADDVQQTLLRHASQSQINPKSMEKINTQQKTGTRYRIMWPSQHAPEVSPLTDVKRNNNHKCSPLTAHKTTVKAVLLLWSFASVCFCSNLHSSTSFSFFKKNHDSVLPEGTSVQRGNFQIGKPSKCRLIPAYLCYSQVLYT